MHGSLTAKLLVAAAAASVAVAGSAMDHMLQYQNLHLDRQKQVHQNIVAKVKTDEAQAQKEPRFLSEKTKGMPSINAE